jgi:hypothetical protein
VATELFLGWNFVYQNFFSSMNPNLRWEVRTVRTFKIAVRYVLLNLGWKVQFRRSLFKTTFTRQLSWKQKLFDIAIQFLSLLSTVVYAHASRRAASYRALPGLQLHLQTAASAETTEASVAFTSPAVVTTVAVASVATTADISFALSTIIPLILIDNYI